MTKHCASAIKKKSPETTSSHLFIDLRNRAKLVSAICICLEQTFSEAHVMMMEIPSAFSKALNAYYGSIMHTTVNAEIAALPWVSGEVMKQRDREEWSHSQLYRSMVEIITTHYLRINSPAA
ncbi:hypothetical protein B0H16DRAFT_1742534 [Mycena metata]|uniref:Uncharacterized protein n=1 Tax=Mycena metata TaxID=1033252 RepID=A0AAD7H7X6_9AGAR|nr:hypothetical protein B0H16DRAFT_1742534 [Mycena metata]